MVDYTDESNISLGKFIASKNNVDEKNVLYFAIAYAVFNTIEQNVVDKNIVNKLHPNFLSTIRKTLNGVNELSPIDVDVVKNYIIKFADQYNSKISRDFLAITNVYSIFNIDSIFGFALLDLVNNHIDLFKEAAKLTIISKVISEDLKNKFLIGE